MHGAQLCHRQCTTVPSTVHNCAKRSAQTWHRQRKARNRDYTDLNKERNRNYVARDRSHLYRPWSHRICRLQVLPPHLPTSSQPLRRLFGLFVKKRDEEVRESVILFLHNHVVGMRPATASVFMPSTQMKRRFISPSSVPINLLIKVIIRKYSRSPISKSLSSDIMVDHPGLSQFLRIIDITAVEDKRSCHQFLNNGPRGQTKLFPLGNDQ